MAIRDLIDKIIHKHTATGIDIFTTATPIEILKFEDKIGFPLPADFIDFYTCCNGFACNEDLFNMTPLNEITLHPDNYGRNWFYFAEYLIYSDMWGLRMTGDNRYEIFNGSSPRLILTSSLFTFLERFLTGNVFDPGGLYDWQSVLESN
ncbi:MAG: SMI1/KNR4 family protein [Ferruginibacter sp.]